MQHKENHVQVLKKTGLCNDDRSVGHCHTNKMVACGLLWHVLHTLRPLNEEGIINLIVECRWDI